MNNKSDALPFDPFEAVIRIMVANFPNNRNEMISQFDVFGVFTHLDGTDEEPRWYRAEVELRRRGPKFFTCRRSVTPIMGYIPESFYELPAPIKPAMDEQGS